MNRRQFLPLVAALPLAVKAVAAIVPAEPEWTCIIKPNPATYDLKPVTWFRPITAEEMDALIERAHRRLLDNIARQVSARYGL